MYDLVDVVCCNTGFAGASGFIEDFSRQATNLAHSCDAFFIENIDFVSSYVWVVGYAGLDHSGCGIDFGTTRFSDSGYTGLVGPVKGYVG